MIGDETISKYLERTASRAPAPGGGAAGGIQAAQAGALIAMAARFSAAEDPSDRPPSLQRVLSAAQRLIRDALNAADADAQAFSAVTEAYALPDASDAERRKRSATIQKCLEEAAGPPLRLIALAGTAVGLGEELLERANPNVLSDIAAAAASARSAAATAQVTLEINMRNLRDAAVRSRLAGRAAHADAVMARSGRLLALIRKTIAAP